jgi:dTDP-4-dehydrorhamnose 3,5-epimerase
MEIIKTKFEGLIIIKQDKFSDKRGSLRITYNKKIIKHNKFVFDCVVDLRKKSKTFGLVFKIILSEKNCTSLYVPEGFAHSYFSYEKVNIIYYHLTDYYYPKYEDGINPLDTSLKIKWPSKNLIISKKDQLLGSLKNFKKKYKYL